MDAQQMKSPFFIRLSHTLLILVLIGVILYAGNTVVMPLILATLFAILLRPIVAFLNKRLRFPHVIAVLIAVCLFVIAIVSIIYFISWHVYDFMDDLPKIRHNLQIHFENLKSWIIHKFSISPGRMDRYIQSVTKDSLENGNELVGYTLQSFSEGFFNLVLIPFYTFLILLYRNLFMRFLNKLVGKENHLTMVEIALEIKIVVQNYIVGLLIEMGIVAVLSAVGYTIIGVPYSILLGVIAAVLNLIPYIGNICAGLIAIVAALIGSSELSDVIGVIVVSSLVQLIDNNLLVPRIVASKVKINGLVSIIAVIIGGMISGVMGMFLAIPVVAILKVVFDRVDGLTPWGYLMGADLPKTYEWRRLKLPDLNAGNGESKEEEILNNNHLS